MAQSELLRLKRIEVDGLFGLYDHRIDLNLTDRATLLHGANGVGKTSILRMTHAMLRGDVVEFRGVPFSRFMVGFEDGSTLELQAGGETGIPRAGTHTLRLSNGSRTHSTVVDLSVAEEEAEDDRMAILLSKLGETAPRINLDAIVIEWLSEFLRNSRVHLIEAQRLVRTVQPPRPQDLLLSRRETVASILECSRDFHRRLDDTMAAYGRHAQALDQSFPQRLISATDSLGPDMLKEQMLALDKKTAEYEEIGLLDAKPDDHPSTIGSLGDMSDATQARVMTLYVRDTADKLKELDDFAGRTRLFLKHINTKYRHKKIELDRDKGLVARRCGGAELPLESLSSGEQHEFVLHYDLLFRVAPNTVVLVDEPELSLHVAWQKRFLSDLLDIVRLSGFDALIATHSPYIIGDRDDLMVGLGDPA